VNSGVHAGAIIASAFIVILHLQGCAGHLPEAECIGPKMTESGPVSGQAFVKTGCLIPVPGGRLPEVNEIILLPGAPRIYRGGIHEGIDFYNYSNNKRIPCGESVINVCDSWVVRVDSDWMPMSLDEYLRITEALKLKFDDKLLDRLRGKQVWTETEDGTIFRYCHLQEVSGDVRLGKRVLAGTKLGTVGNTGTEGGATGTGDNCHLHFEVWPTPSVYLGKGMGYRDAREEFVKLFRQTK